jgi:hypothetical protein
MNIKSGHENMTLLEYLVTLPLATFKKLLQNNAIKADSAIKLHHQMVSYTSKLYPDTPYKEGMFRELLYVVNSKRKQLDKLPKPKTRRWSRYVDRRTLDILSDRNREIVNMIVKMMPDEKRRLFIKLSYLEHFQISVLDSDLILPHMKVKFEGIERGLSVRNALINRINTKDYKEFIKKVTGIDVKHRRKILLNEVFNILNAIRGSQL